MRNLLLPLIFFLFGSSIYADNFIEDNQNIINVPELSFENLSTQYLKFNCLRDRGAEFIDFDSFNGRTLNDSNYCDRYIFADAARSIRSMLSSSPNWNAEEMLAVQDESGTEKNAIIGIMLYKYLFIKENALRDNLIRYENGKVYDNYIDGVHQDPYDIDYLLAFAPQDSIFDNSVTFSFPSSVYKSNIGGKFYFDAGDGNGYRQFQIGDKILINYSNGEHELKLKIDIGSNVTLEAHCKIKTFNFNSGIASRGGASEFDNYFTCEYVSTIYNNSIINGKLSRYKYGKNNQPLIYVEGFDISLEGNKTILNNYNGYGTQGPLTIFTSKAERDIFSSYDFYYVDFEDGTISNRAKAELLKVVIQKINSNKITQKQNIIFGSSMGGLTARYCLCKMEEAGLKHQTSVLICQDTPNLGANIPLGALYTSRELMNLYNRYSGLLGLKNIKDGIGNIKKILDSDAAKELLYNYVTSEGIIDNSVHESFYNELKAIGYPKGDDGLLRCIAICNGNEQIIQPNESLLHFDLRAKPKNFFNILLSMYSPILGIPIGILTKNFLASLLAKVPGSDKLLFYCDIYPTGSNHNICELNLTYKKKVLWLANAKTTLYKYSKRAPSSSINYDIVKGSYYDMNFDMKFEDLQVVIDSTTLAKFCRIGGHFSYANRFLFIPTVSALDIGGGGAVLTQNDYTTSYSMDNRPLKPKHSPFHAYYISSSSEPHIHFSSDMNLWLKSQLSTFVFGNPIGSTGSKYILNNNITNSPIEWSTSDESIATIDQNGTLTSKKHGFVTILATLTNGQVYPKRIMVELPQYVISTYHTTTSYDLSPSTLSANNDYQAYSDLIKFQISVGTPIKWVEMVDNKYSITLTPMGEQKNVYIRPYYVSDDDIIYGETSYITMNTALPYTIEPNYIAYKSGKLNSITVKQNPYFIGNIPSEFKICNIDCKGENSSDFLNLNNVTTVTIEASNIFPSGMIDWFLKGNNQSISESFTIRGKKGNNIQTFNVPLIKQ